MAADDKGDYRIFLGVFPEGPEADEIQRLREQYDPKTAAITAPHVTLAGLYWRTGEPVAESEADVIDQLRAACATVAPFELQLGGIETFGSRVAYIHAEPTPELLAARQAGLDVLGRDRDSFAAHLTIAMRLSAEGIRACADELRRTRWGTDRVAVPIPQLGLMQRGPDDPAWRTIATLALGG